VLSKWFYIARFYNCYSFVPDTSNIRVSYDLLNESDVPIGINYISKWTDDFSRGTYGPIFFQIPSDNYKVKARLKRVQWDWTFSIIAEGEEFCDNVYYTRIAD
jgi:hypothetical protein